MTVLYLIPARGGSERLPRKNLAEIDGIPLVAWAIQHAHDAGNGTVAVSTEDDEIADAAFRYGADCIVRRRPRLAAHDTPMIDVIDHALGILGGFDTLCLLQPTSPLRTGADIRACLDRANDHPLVTVGPNGLLNGAVYVASVGFLAVHRSFIGRETERYKMPADRSIDIDTAADLEHARALYRPTSVHTLMAG